MYSRCNGCAEQSSDFRASGHVWVRGRWLRHYLNLATSIVTRNVASGDIYLLHSPAILRLLVFFIIIGITTARAG